MSDAVIDVHGLTKSFGDKRVVDDVSLRVGKGQIYGFLGPNGSGKTTTLRMLCGLLTPDAGSGSCLGYDIRTQAAEIKRRTGYMTQRFSLYEDLTIRENLSFVARLYALDRLNSRVDAALEQLGLTSRQRQLAGQLSGGWKQRLALAACILHEPELLLLDEPTAGVDPKARRDFWDQIHALAGAGLTVLVSTHYMDEAERCHEILYIAYGRLFAKGTIKDVIATHHLATWSVEGPNLHVLSRELQQLPGVDTVAAFGTVLHVCGRDENLLAHSIAPYRHRPELHWERSSPSLEDIFIQLMSSLRHKRTGATAMILFSLSRFWAILVKEFIQMRRDRLTFGMMMGVPLLQLLLFGYAINTDPKNLPAVAVVAENSVFARSLLRAMENTGYIRFIGAPVDANTADRLIRRGDVQFAVHIPPNFAEDIVRGRQPALLVEADATDPVATGNAVAALQGLDTTALVHDLKGPLADLQQDTAPFEVRLHKRYNAEGITQYNIVPGLMGVVLTMTMVMMTSLAVTRERERGTMENLLAMPVLPLEVMLGKILPYIVVGYVQVAIIIVAARYLFTVPLTGSLPLLSLVAIIFIAANLAVGFTFSTMTTNQLQAMQMSVFFFLPSLLLSGFMFPFRGMPQWAQLIGEVLPLTHFLRIVRGILLKGNGWPEVWPDLWPILLFLLVAAVLAMIRYRRTLD